LSSSKEVKQPQLSLIEAEAGEFIVLEVNSFQIFVQERFSLSWVDEKQGVQGIFGITDNLQEQIFELLFFRKNGWTMKKVREWLVKNPKFFSTKLQEAIKRYDASNRKPQLKPRRRFKNLDENASPAEKARRRQKYVPF